MQRLSAEDNKPITTQRQQSGYYHDMYHVRLCCRLHPRGCKLKPVKKENTIPPCNTAFSLQILRYTGTGYERQAAYGGAEVIACVRPIISSHMTTPRQAGPQLGPFEPPTLPPSDLLATKPHFPPM